MENEAKGRSQRAIRWHRLSADKVAQKLGADVETGLEESEAAARLERFGPNILRRKTQRSAFRIFARQFSDPMIVALIAAAAMTGVIGDAKDTIVIFSIVLLNAAIGFTQEFRAERALAALGKIAAPSANVLRGGKIVSARAQNLVPGDIVLIDAGSAITADMRLIETAQFRVDESSLTGESVAAEKEARADIAEDAALGDRINMAFRGTFATHGRAKGIAVATGMETELGHIAAMLETGEQARTPLQLRLARFGRWLGLGVLGVCLIIFLSGLARGEPWILMLLTAVSVAVAAIPEALPAVVTILLALGARRMAKQNALVRRLPAVEALGSVTYICCDKTGTLTENKMHVERLAVAGRLSRLDEADISAEPFASLFEGMALCNDADVARGPGASSDQTEAALVHAVQTKGLHKTQLERDKPRVGELAFDSERRRMTTIHQAAENFVAYTKGAPETVIPLCSRALGEPGPFEAGEAIALAERMASEGLRVLAVAKREFDKLPLDNAPIEHDLVFLGLVGLLDPPRKEAKAAIETCRRAGITTVMITGDHAATARAIAQQIDLAPQSARVVTGSELARIGDEDLEDLVDNVRIYARTDPAQKIRIVKALQRRGELVAVTGDGINDGPALSAANVGVAMGRAGTDVAREASSLILLDDNFATIARAVREGRRIFDNVRKFIRFIVTCNLAEVLTIFLAPLVGLPIPLLPIQILWVNLVTDSLPGLALAAERAERNIMERPPRPPNESIFSGGMWQHMVWVGLLMAGIALVSQAYAIVSDSENWRTIVFTVLVFSQMWHVLAIRSERESLFALGIMSNRPLLGAVVLTGALQLAIIYVPWLNPIFETAPLSMRELALCAGLSFIIFVAVESEKLLTRKGLIYKMETP